MIKPPLFAHTLYSPQLRIQKKKNCGLKKAKSNKKKKKKYQKKKCFDDSWTTTFDQSTSSVEQHNFWLCVKKYKRERQSSRQFHAYDDREKKKRS